MSQNSTPRRKYPRKCFTCKADQVVPTTVDRTAEIRYDGTLYTLDIRGMPVNRCDNCGNVTVGDAADECIDHALREKLHLLQPAQIRESRDALGLTQVQLAAAIRCAPESISRWESGMLVQSRAYDQLLRAYFGIPAVRALFSRLESGLPATHIVDTNIFVATEPRGYNPAMKFAISTQSGQLQTASLRLSPKVQPQVLPGYPAGALSAPIPASNSYAQVA